MYYFIVKLHVRYFEELFILKNLSKSFFFLSIFYLPERSLDFPLYFVIQLTFSFKYYVVNVNVIFLT